MRVAIIGAGAVAYGYAALFCRDGHDPALWSPSGARTAALAEGAPLVATGEIAGEFRPHIAASCAEALAGAAVAVIALPANGHRAVMEAMAPHLRPDQVVIISSHASLGALYLARLAAQAGLRIPIVALSTTVLRARQPTPTSVKIATIRKKVDFATMPASTSHQGREACVALFGERFVERQDVLAITLSNVNPQSHMALALCNFTRMEKGEAWGQNENMTDAVGRLLEALDAERLAIAEAFGLTVRSMREHYSQTYGVPDAPLGETARLLAQRAEPTLGPATIDTRYVLEDVPFGLAATVLLGHIAGRAATLHESGIRLFSALYGRNLAGENDLLLVLALDQIEPDRLRVLAQDGWPEGSAETIAQTT